MNVMKQAARLGVPPRVLKAFRELEGTEVAAHWGAVLDRYLEVAYGDLASETDILKIGRAQGKIAVVASIKTDLERLISRGEGEKDGGEF